MDKKKAICEYLRKNHIGKENAIHSKELEKLFLLDGRNIRRKISTSRRKTGSKKKSTTAQPPGQTLSVSPAGLAMRSGRCTDGTFPLVRGSEVRHDEPPPEGGKVFER